MNKHFASRRARLCDSDWLMNGSKVCSPQKTFPLDGNVCRKYLLSYWHGNQHRSLTFLQQTNTIWTLLWHRRVFKQEVRSPYLGTVKGVVQLVSQLLLLLPGRLDQAGVDEGERLHDLLHGKARPGGLLLRPGGAEHLVTKKMKYPAVASNLSPLQPLKPQSKSKEILSFSLLISIIASVIESWVDTATAMTEGKIKMNLELYLVLIRRTFRYIYIIYICLGKGLFNLFLDSSEFFNVCQVVKNPKKVLKRPKKGPKKAKNWVSFKVLYVPVQTFAEAN